jgi:hypothetical protein
MRRYTTRDDLTALWTAAAELRSSASCTNQPRYIQMFLRAADSLDLQADLIAIADSLDGARTISLFEPLAYAADAAGCSASRPFMSSQHLD